MSLDERATGADVLRQAWVGVSFVVGIVGVLVGVGLLGTRVEESSGGSLASDATLLAPAQPAFSIRTAIYLGLTAYVVHQWLPAQRTDRRHRDIGWLAGVTLLLNAAWLLVTQQGWIWVSVAVILVLAGVLSRLVRRLDRTPSFGVVETLAVDVTFGAYLGWVVAAAGANVAAAVAASGSAPDRWSAVGLVLLVSVCGAVLVRRLSGRLSVASALAWGLSWIAVGRVAGTPADPVVGAVAAACAVGVLWVAWGSQDRWPAVEDAAAG